MPEVKLAKKTWLDKFLDVLERACNKLPVPAIMFIYLFFKLSCTSLYKVAGKYNSYDNKYSKHHKNTT